MSDKALIIRSPDPVPNPQGLVIDNRWHPNAAGRILAEHYNTQTLADGLLDFAETTRQHLKYLGRDIHTSEWRDPTTEEVLWNAAVLDVSFGKKKAHLFLLGDVKCYYFFRRGCWRCSETPAGGRPDKFSKLDLNNWKW